MWHEIHIQCTPQTSTVHCVLCHAVCGADVGLHVPPAPGWPCTLDPGLVCIRLTDQPRMPDAVCRASLVLVPHAACDPDWPYSLSVICTQDLCAAHRAKAIMFCMWRGAGTGTCTARSPHSQIRECTACGVCTGPTLWAGSSMGSDLA